MAKKDDDLGLPGHHRHSSHQWQGARPPRRRALFRLFAYAVFIVVLVLTVIRLLPSSTAEPNRPASEGSSPGFNEKLSHQKSKQQDRNYGGPIQFPQLGKTLQNIAGTGGSSEKNRNVLFATGSLRSASTLLPMACQMAANAQNHVHFVLASRSEITMEDLFLVNGIDESCKLFLHDARPDSVAISSDARMRLVAALALHHITSYMHPQAIVVDSSEAEEDYFLRAFRDQVRGTKSALIELPENPVPRLSWITKLDASALSAWNKVDFDIVVQAPLTGSGNLIRLLSSLRRADLSAVNPPHLTIELPYAIEEALEKTLARFKWPAYKTGEVRHANMLSLRHRIPHRKMTEEESSVRFLESFWPSEPRTTHVLVLAPHTEISPQFFHYVKYTLLQTLYSGASVLWDWRDNIMGISFQSPTTHLDATTPFTIPEGSDSETPIRSSGPFLWQSPSSDATLFLGDKWMELHGYVSQLLESQGSREEVPAMLARKDVSKKYPAWLEYVLQLARLRGYVTLYPSPETAKVIMGSHSDLGNIPEEHLDDKQLAESMENGKEDTATSGFDPTSQVDMLATLPKEGHFVELPQLPLLSLEGTISTLGGIKTNAQARAKQFRREVGQCEVSKGGEDEDDEDDVTKADRLARDLFCKNKKNA